MATGRSGSSSAPELGSLLKKWNRLRRKVLANDIVQIPGDNSVRMVAADHIQKERLRAVASRGRVWVRDVVSRNAPVNHAADDDSCDENDEVTIASSGRVTDPIFTVAAETGATERLFREFVVDSDTEKRHWRDVQLNHKKRKYTGGKCAFQGEVKRVLVRFDQLPRDSRPRS
jgi:hypothetical protein